MYTHSSFLLISLVILNLRDCQGYQNTNRCQTPRGEMGTCVQFDLCPGFNEIYEKSPAYASQLHRVSCNGRTAAGGRKLFCCVYTNPNRCQTPRGEMGTCVPFTLCPGFNEMFEKSPAYASQLHRVSCNGRVAAGGTKMVCCINPQKNCRTSDLRPGECKPLENCEALSNIRDNENNDEHIKAALSSARNICYNKDNDVCCPREQITTRGNYPTPTHPFTTEDEGCGISKVLTKKVIGGTEAEPGAWPWMALVGTSKRIYPPFVCGGSLVSHSHVITAAHCVEARLAVSFVRLGAHRISDLTHVKDINIANLAKHPQYHKTGDPSDLAVLLLEESVTFTAFIKPICMPVSEPLRSESFVDARPYIAGWGLTEKNKYPDVLMEAPVPVMKNDVCYQIYKIYDPTQTPDQFDNSILCAGYEHGYSDACSGDSGGPLMLQLFYRGRPYYYLIGIISYGRDCNQAPGIYTSTQHFMDWIIKQTKTM